MRHLRQWSVRHSRTLNRLYNYLETALTALHPLWQTIGYTRADKPVATIERAIKGALFDCQMCGTCTLSSTGMACPMNCPKQLRNGPCGGVRADGNCEVLPNMPCVWQDAVHGNRRMPHTDAIMTVQPPVDWSRHGRSAWLNAVRLRLQANTTTTLPPQ